MKYDINGEIKTHKSEKEEILTRIHKSIETTTDTLGNPIDDGIKESVIMFNVHGLRTIQSCEGHPDEFHTAQYTPARGPWIEVYPEEPKQERWQDNDRLRENVEREGGMYRVKAIDLLNKFYKHRTVPYDVMLGINSIAYGFKVQSNGLETLQFLTKEKKMEKEKLYKKEMRDFTEFLKKDFLMN